MEIRELIIAQKDSSARFIFNRKVNLVTSTELSDELLKANYDLENSSYFYESLDNLPLNEVFQIKVRIASTGVMMLNFPKEGFSEETKQKLFEEISGLKDNQTPTADLQKEKISKVIDIANKYTPIYVSYANTGDFVFVRSTFEEILASKEIDFPVLLLLNSIGYVDQPSNQKKKKGIVKTPSQKREGSSFSFKEILPQLKSLDYIFFGVFSIFIAFGLVVSIFEIMNGEGIAAFLIILTIAFYAILNYATYKAFKENEYFEYKLKRMIVPAIYILVGIVLGIVVGYSITTYVIKVKEEIEINTALIYGFSIPVSILLAYSSLATPKPLGNMIAKMKKKNK